MKLFTILICDIENQSNVLNKPAWQAVIPFFVIQLIPVELSLSA